MVAHGSKGQTVRQDGEGTDTEAEDSAKTTKTKDTLEFEAKVHVSAEGLIAAEFKFQQEFTEACFTKADDTKKDADNNKHLHWASTVCLLPGRPAVAGTTISGHSAALLVLQADVMD